MISIHNFFKQVVIMRGRKYNLNKSNKSIKDGFMRKIII